MPCMLRSALQIARQISGCHFHFCKSLCDLDDIWHAQTCSSIAEQPACFLNSCACCPSPVQTTRRCSAASRLAARTLVAPRALIAHISERTSARRPRRRQKGASCTIHRSLVQNMIAGPHNHLHSHIRADACHLLCIRAAAAWCCRPLLRTCG